MKASKSSNYDRYLRVAKRLATRYRVGDTLVISVGSVPSRYSRLEQLAFWRYAMGDSRAAAAARIAQVRARAQQLMEAS